MRRWKRIAVAAVAVLVIVAFSGCGAGWLLFGVDHQDSLRKVDAIVVLGGEHDGREDYAIGLAHAGYSSTVLVSNPDLPDDDDASRSLMRRVCAATTPQIAVVCFEPSPSTTRGEARFAGRIAAERGWRSLMIVTWPTHLVRARFIFGKCFAGELVMRSVPGAEPHSLAGWSYSISYQGAALAKASFEDGC